MQSTAQKWQPSGLELLGSLSENGQREFYRSLTPSERARINYDWRGFLARSNQLAPGTPGATDPRREWIYWLLQAGRGFGKTRTGAEQVREWASQKCEGPIHLIAPTAGDIRKVMVEGPSGLLKCYPPNEAPKYEPSKGHLITWPNGNVALCFSADEPERLRGPQCQYFWADEIGAWRFAEDAWDNLIFGFRIGKDLRGVITSTPKPTDLFKKIALDPDTVITRGSSYENRRNLSEAFFRAVIRKYEGTRLGRQELMAELLEDIPGALWTQKMIDSTRITLHEVRWDLLVRIVVAIDPAVTSGEDSDDTGIIVAALTRSAHVIVLDDLTCHESPAGWARIAINAYMSRRADRIVGEVNNGGDLVERNLRATNALIPYRSVRASRGKRVRAEPAAALYEQGRVHHVGCFPELETQMCIAEGSLITTKRGYIPIEKVHAGDWVLTRIGWCRVRWAGKTGVKNIWEVRTKRGAKVRCTAGHQIWSNRRFIPCSEVQRNDILLTCLSQSSRHSLSSRGSGIFETSVMDTSRPQIGGGGYCSIDQSGKRSTVQSLKGGTFTTSITTEEIIRSPTSKHYPHRITRRDTVHPARGPLPQRNDPREAKRYGLNESRAQLNARNAESGSWCEAIRPAFVEDTVESVIECGYLEPVFDLSIEEQPEMFAGSILVHNCSYVPGITEKSPDRMDALVWAIAELVTDVEAQDVQMVYPQYEISPI